MALVAEFKNDRELFRNAVRLIKVLVNSDEGKKCLAQGTGESELLKVFTHEDPKVVLSSRRKRMSPAERRRARKSFCKRHKLHEPYHAARNFYLAERKEELLAKYSDGEKTLKELNEIASKEWDSFSDDKKEEYEHIKEDKWNEFHENVRNADPTGAGISLWVKQKSKYITSPYILFSNEHREEIQKKHPDAKMGELTKHIATAWNSLKKSKKDHYVKLADENKAKRDAEKAQCENNDDDNDNDNDNDNETDPEESAVSSPDNTPSSSPSPSPQPQSPKGKNKKHQDGKGKQQSGKSQSGNKKGKTNKNSDDATLSD